MPDLSRFPWAPALLLSLLGVALWSMPYAVQGGDAGEFAAVAYAGGLPHPPGFPLMRTLFWPTKWLIAAGMKPMRAIALLPSLLTALAFFGLSWVLGAPKRAVQGTGATIDSSPQVQDSIAALLCFGLATSGVVLRHAYDIEVWGPLIALIAAVLCCVFQGRSTYLVACIWGLCIAHHPTGIWLAPLIIAHFWQHNKDRPRSLRLFFDLLTPLFCGALLCWSVLLTLCIGPGGVWRWGDLSEVSGFLHHVLRKDYGTFSLGLQEHTPSLWELWGRHVSVFAEAYSGGLSQHWLLGAAVYALVLYSLWRPPKILGASLERGLAATVVLSGLAFASLHNLEPGVATSAWILERFDLMPLVVSLPLVAAWLQKAWNNLHKEAHQHLFSVSIAAIFVVGTVHPRRFFAPPRHEFGVEVYAKDLCRSLLPDEEAYIFGSDDHRSFPQLYLFARQNFPRCHFIDAALLPYPWYRKWIKSNYPELPVKKRPVEMIFAIQNDEKLADRGLYISNLFSKSSTTVPRAPQGILWRVFDPQRPPTTPSVIQRHLEAFSRYEGDAGHFAGVEDPKSHPWSARLWKRYQEGAVAVDPLLEELNAPETTRQKVRELTARWRERLK